MSNYDKFKAGELTGDIQVAANWQELFAETSESFDAMRLAADRGDWAAAQEALAAGCAAYRASWGGM